MRKKTPHNVLIDVEQKISGHFHLKVERLDENGNRVVDREYKFDNLITNNGMNRFGTVGANGGLILNIQVGSGSAAPQVTDTQLGAFVAAASSMNNGSIWGTGTWVEAGGYFTANTSAQFGQGVAAGNLSEVGAGTNNDTNSGNLFSRALILDTNGQPTTITILPTEFLTVTYELRLYRPTVQDTTAEITVAGVPRTLTIRQSRNTNGDYWQRGGGNPVYFAYLTGNFYYGARQWMGDTSGLGAPGDDPVGTGNSESVPVSIPAYVMDSYYREFKTEFSINQGNGTFGALQCRTGMGTWQVGILPRIVKDNTMTMSISFRVNWARYTP